MGGLKGARFLPHIRDIWWVAIAFPEMGGLKVGKKLYTTDRGGVAIAFPEMGGLKVDNFFNPAVNDYCRNRLPRDGWAESPGWYDRGAALHRVAIAFPEMGGLKVQNPPLWFCVCVVAIAFPEMGGLKGFSS